MRRTDRTDAALAMRRQQIPKAMSHARPDFS
jgi:hypothetical protein